MLGNDPDIADHVMRGFYGRVTDFRCVYSNAYVNYLMPVGTGVTDTEDEFSTATSFVSR